MSDITDLYHSDDEATSPISILTSDPFFTSLETFPAFDPLQLMQQMLKGFCLPEEEEVDVPRCIRVAEPVTNGLQKNSNESPLISSVPSTDEDDPEDEEGDWMVGSIVPGTPRLVRIGKGLETFFCSAFLFGMTLYILQRLGQNAGAFWEWHYKNTSTLSPMVHAPSVALTFK